MEAGEDLLFYSLRDWFCTMLSPEEYDALIQLLENPWEAGRGSFPAPLWSLPLPVQSSVQISAAQQGSLGVALGRGGADQ